ncbi:Putative cytochrome B561 [Pseudoxanthomonas spadix BD-a59]|uniref:Cytochrome B561 n=1 Tax=Pseudoxanthomonas spadix (strain BD-a59) TaxID=1045855 RepID=G7USQ8_PSEUP|nr:cytochrome b [Pseudoxanthomonas spadix]AER57309.1 Putative cytochrome B561 [Pseudoxanthomonas spadix BD-a59]
MTRPNAERWGAVSQALHWLIVLMIFGLAVVGLTLDELPRTPSYFWVYTAHKSMGITVLALVLVRLAWRLYAGAPRPVPGTPGWQHATAVVTHVLLYAVMFAMPLSGWLYDSASGLRPFKLFGLLEMPKLVAPDEAIAATAHEIHEWGLYVLIVLVMVHAGAALYHHLFLGDATLARMLPRGWLRASAPAAPGKEP